MTVDGVFYVIIVSYSIQIWEMLNDFSNIDIRLTCSAKIIASNTQLLRNNKKVQFLSI